MAPVPRTAAQATALAGHWLSKANEADERATAALVVAEAYLALDDAEGARVQNDLAAAEIVVFRACNNLVRVYLDFFEALI